MVPSILCLSDSLILPFDLSPRDLLGADVIMSPARRSLRLADKVTAQLTVSSIMEMPDDVNFAYCPNGALM